MSAAPVHLGVAAGYGIAARSTSDPAARAVLNVLAARHLGQAALLRRPTPLRRRLVTAVDVTHGATAVAWAVAGPRERPLGWLSTALTAVAVVADLRAQPSTSARA
jgi:hypothetical protein